MKNYISTLQSQIARNSVEITFREKEVVRSKQFLKMAIEEFNDSTEEIAGVFKDISVFCLNKQIQVYKKEIFKEKKTIKKLVENQKTLKKLKTQLVLLDNLYGEEDW